MNTERRFAVSEVVAALSLLVGVIGIVVAIVSNNRAADANEIAARLNEENQRLNDRIAEFQISMAEDDLVLVGGGSDFVRPDQVLVTPFWSATSGVDLSALEGETFEAPLAPLNIDASNQTIRFSDIVESLCELPDNESRCQIAQPARIRIQVDFLGRSLGATELSVS